MLQLPDVTLIALTNKDFDGHKRALDTSSQGIEWGDRKIIWDETIRSIDDWNYKIVFELFKYVKTEYAFLFHADGYVINPHLWNPQWLEYDYVGAPWPLPRDDYSYRDEDGNVIRVGNSVSLRSRSMLIAPHIHNLQAKWRAYYGNTNEDGFLCCHNRKYLECMGMKYAPLDVAKHFSKEHTIPENEHLDTFAFHSL